ncbi:hypothetical protein F4778DRAFT_682401 [Xylariomycetidae sp. FL2044]|nr:hypothetical protein F4778DRAFT_682401 [Xylariomycetidae sp. FL2044]
MADNRILHVTFRADNGSNFRVRLSEAQRVSGNFDYMVNCDHFDNDGGPVMILEECDEVTVKGFCDFIKFGNYLDFAEEERSWEASAQEGRGVLMLWGCAKDIYEGSGAVDRQALEIHGNMLAAWVQKYPDNLRNATEPLDVDGTVLSGHQRLYLLALKLQADALAKLVIKKIHYELLFAKFDWHLIDGISNRVESLYFLEVPRSDLHDLLAHFCACFVKPFKQHKKFEKLLEERQEFADRVLHERRLYGFQGL